MCGGVSEPRQPISEPRLRVCVVWGGQVRRLLSAARFILKGGGWYVTDYPSESRKKALQSEKSSEKPADKPAEKTTDKPAEKATDKPVNKPGGKSTDTTSVSSPPATKSD